MEMTGLSHRPAPAPAPVTLTQAEEGSAAATAAGEETKEERRKAEAKERVEGGKATVAFSFSVLLGCLCFFPNDSKEHKSNVAFSICFFLAFAAFVCGNALMVLSMSMLDLRADLVTVGQYAAAANYLAVSCAVLSVLTLFSLVALVRNRQYRYLGLAAVTVVLLPAVGVHWYLRRRTGGSDDEAAEHTDEDREELEAAEKITSCVTNSSFAGLVGVLFSSPGAAAAEDYSDSAAYVAIFFLFATAVMGMFVMTVTKEVSRIIQQRLQRQFITAIRLANALLLCSLACAGLASGFAVLGFRVFAAFAPLVTTGVICFLLGHRANDDQPETNQEQLQAMEDVASKVTFGGIMSVLAASVGAKYSSQQVGVGDTFMVVLTSAFVSGLGIMLLAAVPWRSARALLAPVAKVVVWSSVALFAATAVAVYSVELWTT